MIDIRSILNDDEIDVSCPATSDATETISGFTTINGHESPSSAIDPLSCSDRESGSESGRESGRSSGGNSGRSSDANLNIAGANASPTMSELSPDSRAATSPSCEPLLAPTPPSLRIDPPGSKIHKKFLKDKRFVKLAIRKKSATKTNDQITAKLHIKYLEAHLQVKLVLVNNLTTLYNSIVSYTNKKPIVPVFVDDVNDSVLLGDNSGQIAPFKNSIVSRSVQIIDNNLVNLAGYSPKTLSFSNSNKSKHLANTPADSLSLDGKSAVSSPAPDSPFTAIPIFNSLDTAVHSLFGIDEYTLIRITRSTTDDDDGSVILKLETAAPGDESLIDELEYSDEMLRSLGKIGSTPLNLFIKKLVARPRYKNNMRIFLMAKKLHFSLYTDQRMFERDMINGIIDLQLSEEEINCTRGSDHQFQLSQPPNERAIYVTFPYNSTIEEYKRLVRLTREDKDESA